MGSRKSEKYPTPTTGAGGQTQMETNITKVKGLKNNSASWADDAEYVIEQFETWLATVTVS